MEYRKEHLANNINEMDVLLNDYFERTIAQQGQPKLDMDWATLARLDKDGNMALFVARDDYKMVGFAMYLLFRHTHHRGVLFAICDILAVNPDYRGQGIATMLVQRAMKTMRHMGVEYMVHGYRVIYDTEPLFPKLGFNEVERMYIKAL